MTVRPIRQWPFGGPIPGLSGSGIDTTYGAAMPAAPRRFGAPPDAIPYSTFRCIQYAGNPFSKKTLADREIGEIYSLRVYRRALSRLPGIT
jgi:hypothetical protein